MAYYIPIVNICKELGQKTIAQEDVTIMCGNSYPFGCFASYLRVIIQKYMWLC